MREARDELAEHLGLQEVELEEEIEIVLDSQVKNPKVWEHVEPDAVNASRLEFYVLVVLTVAFIAFGIVLSHAWISGLSIFPAVFAVSMRTKTTFARISLVSIVFVVLILYALRYQREAQRVTLLGIFELEKNTGVELAWAKSYIRHPYKLDSADDLLELAMAGHKNSRDQRAYYRSGTNLNLRDSHGRVALIEILKGGTTML